jgi:hypothetical protein
MKQGLKFGEVVSRAKIALSVTGDADLAGMLGLSAKAFSNRRKAGSIPFEQLTDLLSANKADLCWVFTGELDSRAVREAIRAATEVGLYYSPVGRGLLQDMQDIALTERLDATQLRERFQHRLPCAVAPQQELALLDYYRSANEGDKQSIARIAALAAQSVQPVDPGSASQPDYSEEERCLVAAYRALPPPQRAKIQASVAAGSVPDAAQQQE